MRKARKIIRLPSSASKVVGSPQKGRAPKTDLESRAVGSLEARIGERVRRRTPVKEKRTLQEQSGILEIQVKKEQEDQEKRLLAQLESLCLDAGRRNSQHEQQHEQKVEKSLEEIPRGSEVIMRRRLRLSFVDPESLEKERTSQREPFEGGRVAKEQKQVGRCWKA